MNNYSNYNEFDQKRARTLVSYGAEIAGGVVSASLATLTNDPVNAALYGAGGPLLTIALKLVGGEISNRILGHREKVRIGAVLAYAIAETKNRIADGENIRTDGFFDKKHSGLSDAEEVIESVLLKSQREPEEKKIQYMGYLLSNIAFDPEISAQMAHQITKAAEQLSYRQLCIMKLSAHKKEFSLREKDFRGQDSFTKELYQILYECHDLYQRALINFGGEVIFGPTDIAPGKMTLQALGIDIFNLMGLEKIPIEEINPIILQLIYEMKEENVG